MIFDGSGFGEFDTRSAPTSGLTRAHWQGVADHLLRGSSGFATESLSGYRFPGPTSANGAERDELEGFARLTLLAAFRLAKADSPPADEWYGRILEGLERAGNALALGRSEAWPTLARVDQALVEASSLALALSIAPSLLWEPLSSGAKAGLVDWFAGGTGHDLRWNNWAFFDATIATFLERVGHASAAPARMRLLSRIEPWYLGDGWYSDGAGTCVDYYNAWSFHFYLPLLAHFSDDVALERVATRVHPFIDSFQTLIDSAGAPVYFGRSLTYRFAAVAPFFSHHLVAGSRRPPGMDRALASSTLRRFVDAGSLVDGRLPLGWWGEQPSLSQGYSSGGSPLWAAKAFVGLMFDSTHPVWSEPEPEAVAPQVEAVVIGGGAAVVRRSSDGIATLHSASMAQWPVWAPQSLQRDPLYERLAYSSVTAPDHSGATPENSVLVTHPSRPDGYRGAVEWSATGEGWNSTSAHVWHERETPRWITYRRARLLQAVASAWQPRRWKRSRIGVLSIVADSWELRLIAIDSVPRGTVVTAGGYALAGPTVTQRLAAVWGASDTETWVATDSRNPFGAELTVPGVRFTVDGNSSLVGMALCLTRSGNEGAPPRVTKDGDRLRVRFENGEEFVVVATGTRLTASRVDQAASTARA